MPKPQRPILQRSPQTPTSGRLDRLRQTRFVGREQELEVYEQALQGEMIVLFVHGPGGVGKTTLLSRFAAVAQEQGVTVIRLDCRNLDPSPMGLEMGLQIALGTDQPLQALAALPKAVLMLDTYEALAPLDGWLREQLLPQLPPQTLLVLAGRNPPGQSWRSEVGWGELLGEVGLENFSSEESRLYLSKRGLSGDLRKLLDFTQGHPLALSLLADVWGQNPHFDPHSSPDLIRSLLGCFVQDVPGPLHRLALEALAQVRALNEPQLREALGQGEVHSVFEWLRGLSFVQQGPFGLFPHDLVREVLDADFHWRDPDAHAEMHRRVRQYYFGRILKTQGQEQLRHIFDLVFLHRNSPLLKQFYDWKNFGSLYSEAAKPADHPAILAMVGRHEGAESAALAHYWLVRQPEAFTVARGEGGRVVGLVALLELTRTTPEDAERDPAVAAVWGLMRRRNPPKSGQSAMLARFFMDEEQYQLACPVCNHLGLITSQRWLTDPRLSWVFFTLHDTDYYRDYMNYYDYHLTDVRYEVGGRSYGAFAHDWRSVTALQWLELVGERELSSQPLTPMTQARTETAPVLSREAFAEALKAALRDFQQPAALAASPLLRTKLLSEPTPQALRSLLWEAARQLQHKPRDEKFYRALEATYLEPAATQELAAERLGLPFGTYRYQLAQGIERVTEWLWQRLAR